MSAQQRRDAEVLRAKYARVHDVPIEKIYVRYLEDDDAAVWADGMPRWTLGVGAPRWVTDHRVRTFR